VAGSLEGPVAKLRRAIQHYITLKYELHWGVDHKRRAVVTERHRDGLEYSVRLVEDIEPISPSWPIVLGEAIYNLRSALDHLVFQLHVRAYRGHVPARVEKNSAFPIFDFCPTSRGGVAKPTDRWDEIGTLGRRERAKVEFLQPYKGWHSPNFPPREVIRQLRWGLRDLNRFNVIDKHRDLLLCNTVAISVPIPQFPAVYGFKQHPEFGVPLESKAKVDTWTFTTATPPETVPVHLHLYSTIGMGPAGDRIDVLPHLGGTIHAVEMVFAKFRSLFPPLAEPLDLSAVHMTRD